MPTDKTIQEIPALPSPLTGTDKILVSRPAAVEDYSQEVNDLLSFMNANVSAGMEFTSGTSAPSGGDNGDIYLKTDEGKLYKKTAGTWVLVYTIASNAADGRVIFGTVAPTTEGSNNDTYINTFNGNIYFKTAGAWVLKYTISSGPAGANGKSVLNGTGVPSSGLGTNGDFYIDTVAKNIYGPKAAGVWGAATSLIGPTGSGSTGAAGAGFIATSITSLSVSVASKTFVTQAGLAYGINEWVLLVHDASNYMYGQITAYSGTSMTVNVTQVVGSGSHSPWDIRLTGEKGIQGEPGPDISRKGTFTMLAGIGTINEAGITANTYVFLGVPSGFATPGHTHISARTVGVSITITSSNASEGSTYPYFLLEP